MSGKLICRDDGNCYECVNLEFCKKVFPWLPYPDNYDTNQYPKIERTLPAGDDNG